LGKVSLGNREVKGLLTLLLGFPRLKSKTWGTKIFVVDAKVLGKGRRFALLIQKKMQQQIPRFARNDNFKNNGKNKI
jgi:hypothetical protein